MTSSSPMAKRPQFSILTPSYNRGKQTLRSIESALNQQGEFDVEIIIVDDSTDATPTVVRQFIQQRSLEGVVRFHANATRAGIPRSRNLAIDMARGEYFVFLDSDDALLPGALERCRLYFSENPDVGLFFGAIQLTSGRPPRVDPALVGRKVGYAEFLSSPGVGEYLPICRAEVMGSNRFLEDVQGFEGYLWASLLQSGTLVYLSSEPLRLYDDGGSDRLSRTTTQGGTWISANHAKGHVKYLIKFGPDLRSLNRKRYIQQVKKAILYDRMAGGGNPAVSEYISANLGEAGAAGRLLRCLTPNAARVVLRLHHALDRLRARVSEQP